MQVRTFLATFVLALTITLTGCGVSSSTSGSSTSITLSPASNTVTTGQTAQFHASGGVAGETIGQVSLTWNSSNPKVATIAGGGVGVWTATATALSAGTTTISASAGGVTATATLTVEAAQFSNASIQGPYAFSFGGSNASGPFSIAGIFQADGAGNITNGLEDLNSPGGAFSNVAFTGTYTVGNDGRGSATTTDSQGTSNFHFVILESGQVQIVEFDASENGSGTVVPQVTSSLNLSAIAGDWTFFLAGEGASGEQVVDGGRFSLDSAGNVTQGVEDYNDGGTVSSNVSFAGTAASVSSNGRGTVSLTGSLGTSNFAFYVASANEVFVVETDSTSALAGTAFRQQSATFADSSLTGSYAYLLVGTTQLGPAAAIGQFNADGNGNITSGSNDANDDGSSSLDQSFTGSYSVGSNGRGTATTVDSGGSSSFAFYLISKNLVVFVETDSSTVAEGLVSSQTGAPFSNSSTSGHYGFSSVGVSSGGLYDSVGQLVSNGSGSLTATEDVNYAGNPVMGVGFSGTYAISPTGRGTAQLVGGGVTSNMVFYVVGPSEVLYLEVDPSEVLTGFAAKQF
jgi:hypothetical protein